MAMRGVRCWATLGMWLVGSTRADDPPQLDTLYDTERFLVPVERAAELSLLLATHGQIRLESADYCAECPIDPATRRPQCAWNISVGSGMSIQGLPGTSIPSVVIQPGSSGIALSGLNFCESAQTPVLLFPRQGAASPATRASTFVRLHGMHVLFDGAAVDNLLFVGLGYLAVPHQPPAGSAYTVGGLHIGPGSSVTNCKFIRTVVQAPWPTVTVSLAGTSEKQSKFRGNVFLWQNSNCMTTQASFIIDGVDELTIVGNDIEAYHAAIQEAAVVTRRSGPVRWLRCQAECRATQKASQPAQTLACMTLTPPAY